MNDHDEAWFYFVILIFYNINTLLVNNFNSISVLLFILSVNSGRLVFRNISPAIHEIICILL